MRRVRAAVSVAILVASGAAWADDVPPAPVAQDDAKLEADRLFQEGRALVEAGKRTEACAKFDLSIRKDPRAVGTMLNLGLCAEEAGQVATALRYYTEARARAKDQDLAEHQQAAEGKIALLSPRVPHVEITLAAATVASKPTVIVDTIVLAPDQLADLIIDPGNHTITVTAPDRLPYSTTIDIAESAHRRVEIPALQGNKTVVLEPSRRRLWGKLTVASGVLVGIGGIVLGVHAERLYWSQFPAASRDGEDAHDAAHECFTINDSRQCNSTGLSELSRARHEGWAATGMTIGGAAAILVGGYIWWRSPSSVQVEVGASHGTIAIRGAW